MLFPFPLFLWTFISSKDMTHPYDSIFNPFALKYNNQINFIFVTKAFCENLLCSRRPWKLQVDLCVDKAKLHRQMFSQHTHTPSARYSTGYQPKIL